MFKQDTGVAVRAFRPIPESAEASLVYTVSFRTARANKEACLRETETDRGQVVKSVTQENASEQKQTS